MGRLIKVNKIKGILKSWVGPLVVAGLCLTGVHQVTANPEPTISELSAYLQNNTLGVGLETVDGYRQVFYSYNGNRIYLTDEQANHSSPKASGRFVVWTKVVNGLEQIFFSDILTRNTVQVTTFGNNTKPDIDGSVIVWQHVNAGVVQSYYWDYAAYSQVTPIGGIGSVEPAVRGNLIAYAQRAADNTWNVHALDINTGLDQIIDSGVGLFVGGPEFSEDGILSNIVTKTEKLDP